MIRLALLPAPDELDAATVQALTDEFIQTAKAVWKQTYIEMRLLKMSHNKCAYCECYVHEESKYMEIEHFWAKSLFPLLVVIWGNLLPSCKRCNGTKLAHDVDAEPIIHPLVDDPTAHLVMIGYRLYPKSGSVLGKTSIEVLGLNDRLRLVAVRSALGTELAEELEELHEKIEEASLPLTSRKQRALKSHLTKLLECAQPTEEYAATAATVLLTDPHYGSIKTYFEAHNLWDATLEGLEKQAFGCSLAA